MDDLSREALQDLLDDGVEELLERFQDVENRLVELEKTVKGLYRREGDRLRREGGC